VNDDVLLVTFVDALDADAQARLDAFLDAAGFVPSADSDLVLRDPRHEVEVVVAGQVTRVDWYATDNGDGTFGDVARAEVSTWQGSKLLSTVTTLFYTDGSAGPTWTDTYSTNGSKRIARRT
jgi:hypothetical protein